MAVELEKLAKDWRVTVFAYCCGFFALTVLGLIDFISAKWKSCGRTLSAGYQVMVCLIKATIVVLFYAYLKKISRNFEEMMPALIVGVISSYRIGQTVWGLAQILEFRAWCRDALCCIKSCYYGSMEELDTLDLDSTVVLNEDVVDNKFTEREVPVKFDFRQLTWKLGRNPLISCTVRWSTAFLCAVGHQWGRKSMSVKTVCSLRSPVVSALSHCTLPIIGNDSVPQLLSVREKFDEWRESGLKAGAFRKILKSYIPAFYETLNIADTDHLSGTHYAPSSQNPRFQSGTLSAFRDDLNKIVSSHRTTSEKEVYRHTRLNRQASSLEQVELLLIAKSLGSEILQSLSAGYEQRRFPSGRDQKPWELLCKQARAFKSEADRLKYVHRFWRLFLVPLWDRKPNYDVLQASAHLDIDLALCTGQHFYSANGSFRVSHMPTSCEDPSETFNLFKQQLEYASKMPFINCEFSLRATLGEVRDILAEWCSSAGKHPMISSSWLPQLPSKSFEFNASTYLCEFSFNSCCYSSEKFVKERFIWECQYALQTYLRNTIHESTNMPASAELIMFFLLGYPHIVVSWDADVSNAIKFEARPVHVPQSVWVEGKLCLASGAITLALKSDEQFQMFEWQNWANAAMGLTRHWGDLCWENNQNFEGPREFVRPVNLTHPVEVVELSDSEFSSVGCIQVWRGWPMFDFRVCRFEMDQLMSSGSKSYASRRVAAEKLLGEIGEEQNSPYIINQRNSELHKDKPANRRTCSIGSDQFTEPDRKQYHPVGSALCSTETAPQLRQKDVEIPSGARKSWSGWPNFSPAVCRFESEPVHLQNSPIQSIDRGLCSEGPVIPRTNESDESDRNQAPKPGRKAVDIIFHVIVVVFLAASTLLLQPRTLQSDSRSVGPVDTGYINDTGWPSWNDGHLEKWRGIRGLMFRPGSNVTVTVFAELNDAYCVNAGEWSFDDLESFLQYFAADSGSRNRNNTRGTMLALPYRITPTSKFTVMYRDKIMMVSVPRRCRSLSIVLSDCIEIFKAVFAPFRTSVWIVTVVFFGLLIMTRVWSVLLISVTQSRLTFRAGYFTILGGEYTEPSRDPRRVKDKNRASFKLYVGLWSTTIYKMVIIFLLFYEIAVAVFTFEQNIHYHSLHIAVEGISAQDYFFRQLVGLEYADSERPPRFLYAGADVCFEEKARTTHSRLVQDHKRTPRVDYDKCDIWVVLLVIGVPFFWFSVLFCFGFLHRRVQHCSDLSACME